ncbi:MAG: type III-B CRISPR module-associated protein Cmr5 [Candidatus Alkanophagales archaeon]|nr:MAG: type III-B CRISPR module-associated protein Cmr5 [Candidatus Alkanophagales archaeon]
MRSLEQERAKFAWACVSEMQREDEERQREYRSYVRRLPSLILTSGLPNALAFYMAKKGVHEIVYQHLNDWFKSGECPIALEKDLLEWLVGEASTLQAFRATEEALLLLGWLKRFAESELEAGEGGGE